MLKHIFAIDDTGSPGNTSQSKTLKSDRKTYVAVFIHTAVQEKIIKDINEILVKYSNQNHTISELHFTDLINRRKEYKNFSSELVVAIINDVAKSFNHYSLPFFIQTITPHTLEENGLKNTQNKSLDEIALDFLTIRIKKYVIENSLENKFEIVMDQGLHSPGHKKNIPSLKEIMESNFILSQTSTQNPLIQVADFFAFAMNRNQMMLIKESRTEFDLLLLLIMNSALNGNEVSGSKAISLDKKNFSKEDYDQQQIEMFKEMGVYEYWIKVNNAKE